MNEYYAVVRSTDHLAHYGIKGMKWGVRRAIERGDNRALLDHYQKAQRKLQKLKAKADLEKQKKDLEKYGRRAERALSVGSVGAGAAVGNYIAAKLLSKGAISNAVSDAASTLLSGYRRKKRIVGKGKGIQKNGSGLGIGPVGSSDTVNGIKTALNGGGKTIGSKINPHKVIGTVAKGAAIAGYGAAAYQGGRALAAKYRTSEKGHQKAVEKLNRFEKEMNRVFSEADKRNRKKKRRS